MTTHLENMNSRKKQNWETPIDQFMEWCSRLGLSPVIDVCATKANTKCAKYFDKRSNGLKKQWTESWFMNPPYNEVAVWIRYAWNQFKEYGQDGLILVFNKTDTKWYHEFVWDQSKLKNRPNVETYPQSGRITFLENGTLPENPAPYGSVWIVFSKTKLRERLLRQCGL